MADGVRHQKNVLTRRTAMIRISLDLPTISNASGDLPNASKSAESAEEEGMGGPEWVILKHKLPGAPLVSQDVPFGSHRLIALSILSNPKS
jgi:hypothetical protein